MSKKKSYAKLRDTEEVRQEFYTLYEEKYFNLWLSSYEWTGISRDQREYIMRKLWQTGSVAAFSIIKPSTKFLGVDAKSFSEGLIGFSTFAPIGFNMYNYPTMVTLINERGVPYIPARPQKNNVDVVLGFAQHSRQPVKEMIEPMIHRLVAIQLTIRTNLFAANHPVAIEVTPDSEAHAEDLNDSLENYDPIFFINVKELDSLKACMSGAPYIIDKLTSLIVSTENDILTFLGIDNMGSQEKQERLLTDEANSNNQLINAQRQTVKSCLDEFCSEIRDVLGFNVSVRPTNEIVQSIKEEKEPKDSEKGEKDGISD
jgi:hypothetical protein